MMEDRCLVLFMLLALLSLRQKYASGITPLGEV